MENFRSTVHYMFKITAMKLSMFLLSLFFVSIACKETTTNTDQDYSKNAEVSTPAEMKKDEAVTFMTEDEIRKEQPSEEAKGKTPSRAKDGVKNATSAMNKASKEEEVVEDKAEQINRPTGDSQDIKQEPKLEFKPVQKPEDSFANDEKEQLPNNEIAEIEVEEPSSTSSSSSQVTPPPPVAISHAKFDELLKKYVSSGKVNYARIKTEISKLDAYLMQLEQTDVSILNRKEQLAFWINAYNAFTIKKIIDNYPLSSITDLDGGKPWDKKWIKLNEQTLSLNNIENDIIRPTFKEPRIHFAVNCAAKSCPPLLAGAWTAANLESNFEKQTLNFINNGTYNELNADNARISKIFEWYAVDFGDIISFINKYSKVKINAGASITYKEYDWSLNN